MNNQVNQKNKLNIQYSFKNFYQGFTLMEILIAMAIIGILAGIVFTIIKPQEILKKNRDFQRTTDMQILNFAIDIVKQEYPNVYIGDAKKIYLSLPDTNSNCSSWLSKLPPLPNGYQYNCSVNPKNTDGTGWIPIDFIEIHMTKITELPINAINSPPYYDVYAVGDGYALSSFMESEVNQSVNTIAGKDNGVSWNNYESGSNLKLIPAELQDGMGKDKYLIAYWPFNEETGIVVFDYGGNGNNGTTTNTTWTTGKFWSALSFNGSNAYINVNNVSSKIKTGDISIVAWIKFPTNYTNNTSVEVVFMSGDSSSNNDVNFAFGPRSPTTCNGSPDGKLHLDFWNTNNNVDYTSSSKNFWSANTWYFIAGTYSASSLNVKLYIDGSQDGLKTGVIRGGTPYSAMTGIGSCFGNHAFFKGVIDDVRIYNRELSVAEIQSIYNIGK